MFHVFVTVGCFMFRVIVTVAFFVLLLVVSCFVFFCFLRVPLDACVDVMRCAHARVLYAYVYVANICVRAMIVDAMLCSYLCYAHARFAAALTCTCTFKVNSEVLITARERSCYST